MTRDPQSEAEWREAATLAEVLLDLDCARQFGLRRRATQETLRHAEAPTRHILRRVAKGIEQDLRTANN